MAVTTKRASVILIGLLWLLAAVLIVWAVSAVPVADLLITLRRLGLAQIAALLLINALIAASFGLRWWIILRAQGHSIPYPTLASYRLVAYSVSYFTPGPHLGGEPLQAWLARRRHGVPGPVAVSSVGLDKLLELLANFSFLLLGIVITIQTQLATAISIPVALGSGLILLAIPAMIIVALSRGRRPIIGTLAKVLPALWRHRSRVWALAAASEAQAVILCQNQPRALWRAVAASLLVWGALLGEFWMAAHFLGVDLSLTQLLVAMTAARIAILLPVPGGLGSLAASQILAMKALGLEPSLGLSLSVLMHARDILFGLMGLWWGSMVVGGWHTLWKVEQTYD